MEGRKRRRRNGKQGTWAALHVSSMISENVAGKCRAQSTDLIRNVVMALSFAVTNVSSGWFLSCKKYERDRCPMAEAVLVAIECMNDVEDERHCY